MFRHLLYMWMHLSPRAESSNEIMTGQRTWRFAAIFQNRGNESTYAPAVLINESATDCFFSSAGAVSFITDFFGPRLIREKIPPDDASKTLEACARL